MEQEEVIFHMMIPGSDKEKEYINYLLQKYKSKDNSQRKHSTYHPSDHEE